MTGIVSSVGRLMGARRRLWPTVAAAVTVTVAATAGAAPGGICPCPVPKPGQVLSSLFPHHVWINALAAAEQPDGRIVVVGALGASWTDYQQHGESGLVLARFRADGPSDTTFDVDGSFNADSVASDGGGRILVAGWDGDVPIVARYGPNGERDNTFGTAGFVRGHREPPGARSPATLGLRVLADGTIVVVRVVHQPVLTSDPAPGGLTIVRLRSDGSELARSTRSAPEWTAAGDRAYGVWHSAAIQADGSVVVAGDVTDPEPFSRGCPCEAHQIFVVRRFRADGGADPAFGDRGRAMTKVGTDAYASDVAVALDGTVVVSGASGVSGGSFAAARFLANGSLDRSFAAGGTFSLETGDGGNAEHVALLADGAVVLAGRPAVTVVRLDREGRLDPAFGVGGRATRTGVGTAVGVFAGKDAGAQVVTTDARIRLLRFSAAGAAETGSDGEVTMAMRPRGANAAVALSRGGVVLAGWIDTGSGIAAHLARTGSQAASRFGNRGRVTLPLGSRAEATAVAEGRDGSLLAAGIEGTPAGERRWFAARIGATGSLDAQFGTGGITHPLAPEGDASVAAVAALADGRSLLLGRTDGRVVLVRLLASGALDVGFGDRGVVDLPLDSATGVVVSRDGRSIVAGSARGSLAVVAVDRSGRPGAPLLAPVSARAVGAAMQRDGAVVVAGTSVGGIVVARWRSHGTLDTSFGTNGVATRVGYDAVGIGVQRDGRVVVATRDRGAPGFSLMRLLHSGRTDATFGTEGIARAQPGAVPTALAIGEYALYVAGTATSKEGTDLAVTMFHQAALVEPTAGGVTVGGLSTTGAFDEVIATATHPAVSPDGSRIAYIGDDDRAPGLFVAGADGGRPRRLTSSPSADGSVVTSAAPVWSRDGRWLAFETLNEAGNTQVSVIQSDGRRLRAIAAGGSPTWGPGRLLAYSAAGRVHTLDIDSGETRPLGEGSEVHWSPRGDLIVVDSSLVRADGTLLGKLPVLSMISWKPDGRALVGIGAGRLVAVDVKTLRARTIVKTGAEARSPAWSRDGRSIAFVGRRGGYQLVIVDARTGRRVVEWKPGGTFARTTPTWGRSGVYIGVSR